jgi:hypothetical protein
VVGWWWSEEEREVRNGRILTWLIYVWPVRVEKLDRDRTKEGVMGGRWVRNTAGSNICSVARACG